jgi:Zn-dependent protease with chaperone function
VTDFFQAQDDARRKTHWFLVLFAICLLAIVSAVYFAVSFGFQIVAQLSEPPLEVEWFTFERVVVTVCTTLFVILVAGLTKYAQLARGGKHVCESVGAYRVDPTTQNRLERRLMNVVEEMSIASGVPMPAVHVLDGEDSINAFAAGYEIDRAALAVTRGALEQLDRDELQAVVAHEFSHILNGDMRLNTRLIAALHGILILTIVGRGIRAWMFSRVSSDDSSSSSSSGRIWTSSSSSSSGSSSRDKNSGNGLAILLAIVVVIILITIIGAIGAFFARLIQAAVCRQRELLADAAAIQFTRQPVILANALKRVSDLGSRLQIPAASSIAHLCFAQGIESWRATHPPIEQRIRMHDPHWDGQAPPERVQMLSGKAEQPTAGLLQVAGLLQQPSLDYAHSLLSSLPEPVTRALHDPTRAVGLTLLLLLEENPEARTGKWSAMQAVLPPEVLQTAYELAPCMAGLGPAVRLPLIELLLPTLRTLPERSQEMLVSAVDRAVAADQRTDLFEFIVQRLLRHGLGRSYTETARQPRLPAPSAQELLAASVVVLSAIVRSGQGDPGHRTSVMTRASFDAGYDPPLALDRAPEGEFSAVHAALDVLRRASLSERRRFLDACERAICADGKVELAEGELFRAIALTLGVPIPPVTPR